MERTNPSHQLKALQTKKRKAQEELAQLKAQQAEISRQANKAHANVKEIDQEIDHLTRDTKKRSVIVSEHAMLRYFERVLGHDLDVIREKILTPENEAVIKHLGNGTFPDPAGYRLEVKDNVIVTII